MSHEKSHAMFLIGAPEIRTAESAIQGFARNIPDPLLKKAGSGNEIRSQVVLFLFFPTAHAKPTVFCITIYCLDHNWCPTVMMRDLLLLWLVGMSQLQAVYIIIDKNSPTIYFFNL